MPDRTCTVDDCERTVYVAARGLCRPHYRVWWRGQRTSTCTIEGCGKPHEAHGYCPMHYRRFQIHGDPTYTPPARGCDIEGCDQPHYGRGWCERHYARWFRHGDTTDARAARVDFDTRFWAKVDKAGPVNDWAPELGPCWLWTAGVNGAGYGSINDGDRVIGAHVAAVLIDGREIPPGHEPDHLCQVKRCVRADHLEVVTADENKRRAGAVRRGRRARANGLDRGSSAAL